MSTVKVIDIIQNVEHVLQDTNIRWPRLELQNWINEAYLAIILLRPDANAKTGAFSCAAGSRQQLTAQFASALKLLDVTRNLAVGSDKRAVRLVARSVLDDQRPTWHAEREATSIQHFMYDARQPKEFFVYPPASQDAILEVVYADAVVGHALAEADLDPAEGNTEAILLDDIYKSAITDWVLYRAYSKDAEYGSNEARAVASYNAFNTGMGNKTQVDAASSPAASSKVT
jgi:hypothetical protein